MPIKIKYIRHHKTPICPRCGSNQTGRFVLYTGLQQERVIGKYLKNAEFVIPVTDQLSENNLFCFNCGIQWRGTITIQYLSRQEFNDIMKLLQINNMTPIKVLNEFYGEANEDVSDADIEEDTQDIVQHGNGKSKDKILNVHHIESRKTGGNSPSNLITLCETCHKGYHKGTVKLPKAIYRGMSFKDASFMGIMRWAFYNRLKSLYPNVSLTYGYITKNARIRNDLPKEHYIDARCISGNPLTKPSGEVFYQKKVRCHNRQIHKNTVLKCGIRKLNQCPYIVQGYRLYDRVMYKARECFVFGRRRDGRFAIRLLDGTKINEQISYKKLRFLESAKHYITERRTPLLIGASSDVPAAM
jgi:hypothetical protein